MASCHATRLVTVTNPQGLHARPADMFVRLAMRFESTVAIVRDGDRFDGKSILSLMTLAAEQGTQLLLQAEGPDAEEALQALAKLFARGFDEMEISEPAKDSSSDG
jgi:phosphotransferase system HPr (HPr) family protein